MDDQEQAKVQTWFDDRYPQSVGKSDGEWMCARAEAEETWQACLDAHATELKAAKVLADLVVLAVLDIKEYDAHSGFLRIQAVAEKHGLDLDALAESEGKP